MDGKPNCKFYGVQFYGILDILSIRLQITGETEWAFSALDDLKEHCMQQVDMNVTFTFRLRSCYVHFVLLASRWFYTVTECERRSVLCRGLLCQRRLDANNFRRLSSVKRRIFQSSEG